MLPILNVGPLALQTAPLLLLLSTWLGLTWSERAALRLGVDSNRLYNLALAALLTGLVGARLGYVAAHPAAFSGNWLSALTPTPAMLDATTGVIVAVLVGMIYGQRAGLPLWPTLDALTPTLMVMLLGIAASNLASGAAFGRTTTLPWGLRLWGEVRHPVQVYEILATIAIGMWVWRRLHESKHLAGRLFLEFVALSAFARLFFEYFRADSLLLVGGLRTAQVAAFLILAACLWLIPRRLQTAPPVPPAIERRSP
jgi:phosphatidylglycerol:prolipoprotein diacylglycerol transferase